MTELHGQLPLFEPILKLKPTMTMNGIDLYTVTDEIEKYATWEEMQYTAVCDDCGTPCATVQQCINAGGAPGCW